MPASSRAVVHGTIVLVGISENKNSILLGFNNTKREEANKYSSRYLELTEQLVE
jgi:hypothetical protein